MKQRPRLYRFLILPLLAAGAFAQELTVGEGPTPLDSLLASDVVVARAGPSVVTVRELFFSAVFGPAFVRGRPDTRRRTLEYMINEKLLALGVRDGANDPRVRENLAALEGDMATEELYRDDVLKNVRVTESEVKEAVRESSVTIALRWLYRREKSGAAAAARELKSGVPFDSLFRREIGGGVSADDRRMSSTLFRLRIRNAPMASLAERLPAGQPSEPVEGPDGYYLFQIDSVDRQILMTGSAEAQAGADARKALTQRKADSLSDLYVRRRMLDANPVIQRQTFDLLRAYLGSRVLPPGKFDSFGLTRNVKETDYGEIDRYGDRILVGLRRGKITLAEFLRWYRLREANLRFRTESPQEFFLSVEDVVWRAVRDRLLVNDALRRGLQNRPAVINQKRWWKDKLVFQVAKDSIMRTIGWADSTLRAYYDGHRRSFRDSAGTVRPFEQVKDEVLRDWYELELNKRVLRALSRLKRQYPVEINEDVLRSIPLDAENDPRAIEVYAVKKGGTFAHPAFPTIDDLWKSWQ